MDKLMYLDSEEVGDRLRRGGAQELCDMVCCCEKLQQQMELAPKFSHPFNMIIAGSSGSGKTYFVSQLLRTNLIQPPPDSIHLFTGVKDASGELQETLEYLRKSQGVPYEHHGDDLNLLDDVLEDEGQKLIILDDLMQQVVNSHKAVELFVSGTHHKNASAIMMWQDLYPQGKYKGAVTLARNAHYHVVFYSPQVSVFKQFASTREHSDRLMSLYRELPKHKQTPLVIDNRENKAWIGLEPSHIVTL